MKQAFGLAGNSGFVRNLDPESIHTIDVSVSNWLCPETGGAYLYINGGGNLVLKLIGDTDFHTLVVGNSYECRMAVKEISSSTTCTGIFALY